ncbi:MAG: CDP-alcohol phosphatidyltransferase family protein [Alistipes sp.]|nr:CDP-alcohol phosphatidyltransferase family protein [Alistipes sp.]MBR2331815.1 CDP-alcohol phosphatidyltransferase family protein [Alistipes sp.]MBR3911882.1 CDP-alcohol phosphatidyltransferase family protein [Alistipes sp.]
MKIRLFTIPNMLTLGNLLCGTVAAIVLLTQHNYELAFYLVVASAVCDFFDGFAARLLKQSSPLGVELDSLADMVSFGVVPAVAMYCLYGDMPQISAMSESLAEVLGFLTLIIAAFSALRLAKFNIDDTQHTEFCGLPTPANGLFCLSVAMLAAAGEFVLAKEMVLLIAVVMAYCLISPIRMFALKIKGFGWKGNELRYSFIALCVVLVALFTKYAVPGIILLYILISSVRHIINMSKK